MREVQTDCPQCGGHSAYLEQESSDYTSPPTFNLQVPWKCPYCGYPEVKWTQWGQTYSPQPQFIITERIVNADGKEIEIVSPKESEQK